MNKQLKTVITFFTLLLSIIIPGHFTIHPSYARQAIDSADINQSQVDPSFTNNSDDSDSENEEQSSRYKDVCNAEDVKPELRQAFGCPDAPPLERDLPLTITQILSNIIFVCGLVAVIFIIIGGIGFMTSNGDAGKTKKAKDAVLYATIGLIICSLAFIIVNWVISSILKQ